MRTLGHLAVTLAILVAWILYGWSPLRSAFFATVFLVVTTLLRSTTRANAHPRVLLSALQSEITAALPVAAANAAAGVIVGVLALTGLGGHFAAVMAAVAGDSVVLALIMTMIASIILGCGMPVSAVYVIMASLTAPTLVSLGLEPLAAHMFIL